jgi:hypothetical protein
MFGWGHVFAPCLAMFVKNGGFYSFVPLAEIILLS